MRARTGMRWIGRAVIAAAVIAGGLAQAAPQALREKPAELEAIGVDPQLGRDLPLELRFHDESNRFVALGEFFDGQRPVVLSFNYSNCPRMCIVQFNNLVAALRGGDARPGRDFQLVSISLDPRERPADARQTQRKYLASYGDLSTEDGWHFLVGSVDAIQAAASACGIRYRYIAEDDFYAHPAAFIFCSPSGQIVRYLNGLDGDLRRSFPQALLEASSGRVGSLVDRALYFASCYEWDPVTGRYTLAALRLMRWAGGLTVVVLLLGLSPYWFFRRRGARRRAAEAAAGGEAAEKTPRVHEWAEREPVEEE